MSRFKALKRVARESRISSLYPITHLNSACVFESQNGMQGSVLRVQGVPFVTTGDETLNQLSHQLHQAVSALDEKFIIYVTIHRTREQLGLSGVFASPFAKRVNEKYHARFHDSALYRNDIYITVVLKGDVSGKMARSVSWFKRMKNAHSSESRMVTREENKVRLTACVNQFASQLSSFSPQVLGSKDDSLGFSELMQFLSIIPNGGVSIPFVRPDFCAPVATNIAATWDAEALYPEGHLGQYITRKRILFGDCVQFQGAGVSDTRFGALLSVKQYGKSTGSVTLDPLLQLECEFISTHTFAPESRDMALKAIHLKRGKLISAEDLGVTQIDALSDLEDDIASGASRLGYHHNSVLLLADSKPMLEKAVLDATKIYGYVDMGLVRETASLGMEPTFWAQIPCNHHFIARASLITSHNFVDFCSLHNEPMGFHNANHLGGAVTVLESVSKTPVYFNYHKKSSSTNPANGHTAIYGATQAGKNTLVAFLDAQMSRYKGRSFFLDRDEASKVYVLASGNSTYTVISPEHKDKVHFNPFKLPDTEENRTFLKNWLAELIKRPNETMIPSELSELMHDCVNYAYDSLNGAYRQLSHVVKILPKSFPRWPELNRWLRGRNEVTDGEWAWLFDNDRDCLSFDFDKVGFDLTWLMDEGSSAVSTPVYMVLLHCMRQSMDGSRLVSFILDEAWQIFNSSFWLLESGQNRMKKDSYDFVQK